MFNHHNRSRPDENPKAVVIDLFAEKRIRLSRKFGALHPVLMAREAEPTPATVTPIASRRRRSS